MGTAQKKVIVRRQIGPTLFGYLPGSGFLEGSTLQLLDLEGRVLALPLAEVRTVFFVRDFNRADHFNPERLTRKVFTSRPRGHGLWVRLNLFPDNELLEGLAATDRSLLDGLAQDRGLFLAPPDTRLNTLRLFVPHLAIAGFQVLGLVGAPKAQPGTELPLAAPAQTPEDSQTTLFEPAPLPESPRRRASGQ